ncbi:DUF2924 domain-containing protein [Sphingomonas sp. NBWT7]|uniref:DUF2924 domain-containing protein n=1 Tax=Sphingomonas sp. NBWT7 TaxID=2596913 RepID=UPI0016263886|nr:DUF2924 domain-containing protein [Sphingomonas sp. NBWT7]QNE32436.1 DUF2924 domain-containing protein [Sphingomonas sp. NBWT7]
MTPLEEELAALEAMNGLALHARWIEVTGSIVPRISPKLLRLALAWEIQAKAAGVVSDNTGRMLDQIACADGRSVAPGVRRLARTWRGRTHIVTIGEDQTVHWDGRSWRSLSEVAREITGTRWSGPAFFGLKNKVAA